MSRPWLKLRLNFGAELPLGPSLIIKVICLLMKWSNLKFQKKLNLFPNCFLSYFKDFKCKPSWICRPNPEDH